MGNRPLLITIMMLSALLGMACDSRKSKPKPAALSPAESVRIARQAVRSELRRWNESPTTLPFIVDYALPAHQRALRVLDSAPAENLSVPELLTLSFNQPRPGVYGMQVSWLEFKSAVHGVRLIDGNGNTYDYLLMDKARESQDPSSLFSAYQRLDIVVIPQGEEEPKDAGVVMDGEVPVIEVPRRLLSQKLNGCLISGDTQYTQPIHVWSLIDGQAKPPTTRPAPAPAAAK